MPAEPVPPRPPPSRAVQRALARATARLPNREDRPEQQEMAAAVGRAIHERRHLIVQAGTGTGKSLGYLVPALSLGARVVVSTATKSLQDQLAHRDLPQLAKALRTRFRFAVLKGRSNYICAQRLAEIREAGEQLLFGEGGFSNEAGSGLPGYAGREVQRLVEWAAKTTHGDRAELAWEPSPLAWAQVSVGSRECPGVAECPSGGACFTEAARRRAGEADVVVVNTHLYAAHLALGEADLLPPHDVVVFDEAHELEDIVSAAFGTELSAARLGSLARTCRPLVEGGAAADAVAEVAARLGTALALHMNRALPKRFGQAGTEMLADVLFQARERTNTLLDQLRSTVHGGGRGGGHRGDNLQAHRLRAQQSAARLLEDLSSVLDMPDGQVAWVEGPAHAPVLRTAPIDIGAILRERLWERKSPGGLGGSGGSGGAGGSGTSAGSGGAGGSGSDARGLTAILTSATVPPHLGERLGLARGEFDQCDVGSPFAFAEQALLYCPLHLPDPRSPSFEATMHAELVALIEAARGRTLALFTSWRATQAAAAAVREKVQWPVLVQSELPKPKLVARFSAEEHSCLFATMGFWQGVDVPGPSLSLVAIDRIPFPRPDDPLLQARRAELGPRAFELIDVPRAATLLAQGAGRLVRSKQDRGVVAVLDRRLGTARYRWDLVDALPPMRRTRDSEAVLRFLRSLPLGNTEKH